MMVRNLSPAVSSKTVSAANFFGNNIPPKPTVSPYEVAIYNQTRRMWEIRPKTADALRRAGLAVPLSRPAAKKTTLADEHTVCIPTYRSGSTSSVNGNSIAPTSPTSSSCSCSNSNKENSATATTTTAPKLFHPARRPRAPLTAEQQARLAAYDRTRQRLRIVEARRQVAETDPRLLACNPGLAVPETPKEEERRLKRDAEVVRRGKELMKMQGMKACDRGPRARVPFLGVG